MKFPGSLTPEQFLAQHWQQKPLGLPGAVPGDLPTLTADELGWLATLEDVESRLVFTERTGNKLSYRVEHGPFASVELEQLPLQDWTLLIQDVEKHLPDFRAWFDLVGFLPDWRIDDLMVSFAAPGGSVGPHLDNYDVFLCQGLGQRSWHLSALGSVAADPRHQALSLLQEFEDDAPWLASSGDALYLPPGIPHWGIANSNCVTYSIGMRAPTHLELLSKLDDSAATTESSTADIFYQDPDLTTAEAEPGRISPGAIQRARTTLGDNDQHSDEEIAIALGRVVTEPKPWLVPECMDKEAAAKSLAEFSDGKARTLHGMTRIAYYESGPDLLVFANGARRTASSNGTRLVKQVCRERCAAAGTLADALGDPESQKLLLWLCQNGVFDL